MSLYPEYRPIGIRPEWEHTAMGCSSAAAVLAKYGGRKVQPVDAVAWFDNDSGQLRRLIADFADGRRADLHVNKRAWRLSYTTKDTSHDH